MDDEREMGRTVSRRKTASNLTFCVKKEKDGQYRKVYTALQKKEADLTQEEQQLISNNVDLVKKARESLKKREEVKARSEEVEDPDDVLIPKCIELAAALRNSHHLVVYTGAGISTAAKIPDYRGSNGIWTLLQKGKDIGNHDLSRAEPTLTHMSLFELYSRGILKYVVSQNCDGLHLRSGLPRSALSEVHGNMHLEVCQMCRPSTQYWRMFDVTENTGRFSHRTMRRCHLCHAALIDTIVHFGERGNLPWPLNWPAASKAADNADTILCIGSSLKVLKKYPWLWGMGKPAHKRPKLYIINLQWTPKDDHAVLKINGRCDRVMQEVMKFLELKIPEYCRLRDPIFCHATHLHPDETHTTSQPELDCPFKKEESSKDEIDVFKQGLKRGNMRDEAGCPVKLRKVDYDPGLEAVVKREPLDLSTNGGSGPTAVPKIKQEVNDSSNSLHKIRTPSNENISALKLIEGNMVGRSKAVTKEKEVKQEPKDSDELIVNVQMPWPACEALFPLVEEVVEQIHYCVDSKNFGDILLETRENDSVTLQLSGIKEDDTKLTILSSGQNMSGNITSEAILCSKVNMESITATFCSTDGKENVAVCVSKVSSMETAKSSKKMDCDKTSDLSNELEKPSKSQAIINGIQPAKNDPLVDNCGALKGQKLYGKGPNDVHEDEVVVLKMLQLEHNYSKSSDDCLDNKDPDSKETKQVTKKGPKDVKNDVKSGNETRRNLRRMSKDAVNYLEADEEEEEVDEDEDEDEDDESTSTQQSVRTSRRVQEKQTSRQQAKQKEKQQATVEAKKKVDVEKKQESNSGSRKPSKPSPPLKDKKLTKADFEMGAELKTRACNFCLSFYMSKTCLFYPSLDFRPRQVEGCICECCDYSSEDEDVEEEGSNGETNEGKGDSTDNADEGASKSSIVNPGWYGKGYRKRFRKRK